MISFRSDAGDSVEIERISNSGPDLLVLVRVKRSDFSAAIDTWIAQESWRRFATELSTLEAMRNGEARVESISPGELNLTIRALDRAGHLGIEGTVGTRTYDSEVKMTFSAFAFDPSQIVTATAETRAIAESLG